MKSTIVFGVLVLSATVLSSHQDQVPKETIPAKGDTIIVRGCLEGPFLQSTETRTFDDTGRMSTPVSYQLKGDKTLLRRLRGQYDGQIVEVTGILKSTMPQPDPKRGTRVGRTRITIGVGRSSVDPRAPSREALPELEVKEYEGAGIRCKR